VGGLWDGLLGEGRNSFIFVSSDWHNRGAGGARDSFTTSDFIPGEYTKLYVPGQEHFRAQSIVDGIGRATPTQSTATSSVRIWSSGPEAMAAQGLEGNGETLVVRPGERITVQMQMTVPASNNSPYKFNNPLLLQDGIQQALNRLRSITWTDHGPGDRSHPARCTGLRGAECGRGRRAAVVYNPPR